MVPDYGLRPRLWLLMKSITEVYISLLWHSIFTMTINFLPKMKNSRFASVKSSKVCECNTALAHTIRAIIGLCWCLLPRQWGLGLNFGSVFFLRSVTNSRLVSKAHAPPVHAYSTWNLQRLLSRKVSADSMTSTAMKTHTNEHTVQGRPTLKDVKCFRNGSLQALREINLRANILSQSWIMLYQRSHLPGLSTLQLDKKHLQKRHRMIVNQVESQHELKNVWAQEQKG